VKFWPPDWVPPDWLPQGCLSPADPRLPRPTGATGASEGDYGPFKDKSMLVSDESLMAFEIPCLVRETRGSGQAKRVQPMEDGTGQNTILSRNDEGSTRNFPRY
jgi:hypothetical protein